MAGRSAPRSKVRAARAVGIVLVGVAAAAFLSGARAQGDPVPGSAGPTGPTGSSSTPPPVRPNIVMFITDDQRWDMIDRMPILKAELQDEGTTFTNGFVVNSLCCPSRTTMLTGRYSHSTGVYTNGGKKGGFARFADPSTLATWLDASGYQTGLVGKYLNGYLDGSYVPPGWDTWDALTSAPRYYDYTMTIDGTAASYGSDPEDYSTDVFAGLADRFIRGADPAEPLFLWFAPYAPHTKAIPAPRYTTALSTFPKSFPPNLNEADVSDKPTWVQALPLSTNSGNATRRQQYRTLLAADDAIGTILGALTDTGRMEQTIFVFVSDNGWSQGSHRWTGKEVAWEESIRVPLIIRYDPLTQGVARTDDHLALNLDLAQTVAEVAGVDAPDAEGMSLVPLLDGSWQGAWRDDFLVEHLRTSTRAKVPSFCAVRTMDAKYIRYSTGEEELYDLTTDPFELQSVHADPTYAGLLASMRVRLQQLCTPPPPGYTI